MTQELEKQAEFVTFHVASTRPVRVEDEEVRFTREALAGLVEQARDGVVPVRLEHLPFVPPSAVFVDGYVLDQPDGESDLFLRARFHEHLGIVNLERDDPAAFIHDDADLAAYASRATVSGHFELEPRNFDAEHFDELSSSSPVELVRVEKWAELPPIEYAAYVYIAWDAVGKPLVTKLGGALLDKALNATTDGIWDWLKSAREKVRKPEREQLFTLVVEFESGLKVTGCVPLAGLSSGRAEATMRAAMADSETLVEFALAQDQRPTLANAQQVTFIWHSNRWRMAWFNDGTTNRIAQWYLDEGPSPDLFLDRNHRQALDSPPRKTND